MKTKYIKCMILSDFTLENLETISNESSFIAEFLKLSYVAMLEAKQIFSDSLQAKDLSAYRQIAHKIKTNLKMLGLYKLDSMIASGKELFETTDEKVFTQFSDSLILSIDKVIDKICQLQEQYR